MKRNIILLAVIMLVAACGKPAARPSEWSQTGFALSFFANVNAVAEKGENVLVSPYSAGAVLAMLEAGADGQTKVELDNALNGATFGKEDLGDGKDVVVQSSNSLWISDNFSVRNRYVSLLEKDFDAFVTTENFADPAAVHVINNWCAEHTSGKITNIIDRIGPNTVMLLINALYFNAQWDAAFDKEAVSDKTFHGFGGDVQVPMMFRRGKYNYAEYHGAKMIELPYQGGRYAMYVILPPPGMSPDALLPYVNENLYKSAMSMLQLKDVALHMPKFKLETSMILNETLQRMGVSSAFTPAADFRGISVSGPLCVDLVKQKCYIDVSEKGTEAAAVTSAQIRTTAFRPSLSMTVDRPFIFVIADVEDKDILFAGKIVNI